MMHESTLMRKFLRVKNDWRNQKLILTYKYVFKWIQIEFVRERHTGSWFEMQEASREVDFLAGSVEEEVG